MNNTILSYIFIALSIIFLFWSIFKTEETRKNNHKDIKIINSKKKQKVSNLKLK